MKENFISQLMLERYNLGGVTEEERSLIEQRLQTDSELQKRLEDIRKSDKEIRINYPLEKLPKMNSQNDIALPGFGSAGSKKKNFTRKWPSGKNLLQKRFLLFGLCSASAVLLFIAIFLVVNRQSAVDESKPEVAKENEIKQKDYEQDTNPENVTPPAIVNDSDRNVLPQVKTSDDDLYPDNFPDSTGGTIIADLPEPSGTGIYTRGIGNDDSSIRISGDDPLTENRQLEVIVLPGTTRIKSGEYSNRRISKVVIPGTVTLIEDDAFSQNPLVKVTIGANVVLQINSLPGNFLEAYTASGKAAGIYTRTDERSRNWIKEE